MRLFEHFETIVSPASNPEKPFVTLFFPQDKILESNLESGEDKEKVKQKHKEDLASIPQFCFPDSDPFADSEEVAAKRGESERFAFVLTDSDGSKRFAFCRRIVDVSSAKALCLVSKNPWFDFFDQVLSFIEGQQKTLITENTIIQILEKVYTYPFPAPGEVINLQFNLAQISCAVGLGSSEFGDVPFSYLITSLKARNIVKLIASMVCERRIIISSMDLPRLSFCVMSLYAALYPFAWHNILIPLLPESLLHYCCAPMPFIVGIHSDSLMALEAMPLEELVFVDLDYDRVASAESFDDDITLLPSPAVSILKANLKALRSATKKSGTCDNQAVSKAFLHFWINIFGNYKQFMTSTEDGGYSFDREGFEAAQTKPYQKFVATFKESQMFEQFVRAVEENRPSMAQFESAVALVEQQKLDGTYEALPTSGSGSFLSMVGSRASSLGNTIANFRKKDSSRELSQSDDGSEEPQEKEKEKDKDKEKKGTKKFQQHWKDVRSAIKDVMDLKYTKNNTQENSSNGSPAPRVRRSTKVLSPIELSSALQNIESESTKGLMSQKSMVELKKRLSMMPMYNSNAQQGSASSAPSYYKPNMYRQSSFGAFQSPGNNTSSQTATPYSYTLASETKKPAPDRAKDTSSTPPRASVMMKPQSSQSSPAVQNPQVIVPPRSNSSDNIPITTITPGSPKVSSSKTAPPGGATPPRQHIAPQPEPEPSPAAAPARPLPARENRTSMAPGRISRGSQLNLSSTHPPAVPARSQVPPTRAQPPPQQQPLQPQNPQSPPPPTNYRASQYMQPPPAQAPTQQPNNPPPQNYRGSQYHHQPPQTGVPPTHPPTPRGPPQNNSSGNLQNAPPPQNPPPQNTRPMLPPRQSSLQNVQTQPQNPPPPSQPTQNTRGPPNPQGPSYTQPPQQGPSYTQPPQQNPAPQPNYRASQYQHQPQQGPTSYSQPPQQGLGYPQQNPAQPNYRASQYHHQPPGHGLPPAPAPGRKPKPLPTQPSMDDEALPVKKAAPVQTSQTSVDDAALPIKKATPRPPPRQSASLRDIPVPNDYVPTTPAEAKFIQDLESRGASKNSRPMTFSPQFFKELEQTTRKQLVDPSNSATATTQPSSGPPPPPGRKPLPKPPAEQRNSVN